jgi:hypothetical protein
MKINSMYRHQDSFRSQSQTHRNGDKIDKHNPHIHDHSFSSALVQTLQ